VTLLKHIRTTCSHVRHDSFICLQLFPEARARLGGQGHTVAGRVMLSAAALLMLGYFIIDVCVCVTECAGMR